MKILLRVSKVLDPLAEWAGKAVSWATLLMIALGAYNALARWGGRYIGADLSSNGLLEAQWYLFSVIFLLGASTTLKADEHVRVDVVLSRLNPRTRAVIDLLGHVLLLLPFCGFAIAFTLPGVLESWTIAEQSPDPGGLPRYPLKALVPLAFALLALQALSEIAKRLLFLFTSPKETNEERRDG